MEVKMESMLYDELEEPWVKMMKLREDKNKQISINQPFTC